MLAAHGEAIGVATNNVAEYSALVAGLEKAVEVGVSELEVISDSELMVKQMRGEYRVKNEALRDLSVRASRLARERRFGHLQGRPARAEQARRPARERGARRRSRRLTVAILPAHADVAQLARASACHAEGRGFESHHPLSRKPRFTRLSLCVALASDRRQVRSQVRSRTRARRRGRVRRRSARSPCGSRRRTPASSRSGSRCPRASTSSRRRA